MNLIASVNLLYKQAKNNQAFLSQTLVEPLHILVTENESLDTKKITKT